MIAPVVISGETKVDTSLLTSPHSVEDPAGEMVVEVLLSHKISLCLVAHRDDEVLPELSLILILTGKSLTTSIVEGHIVAEVVRWLMLEDGIGVALAVVVGLVGVEELLGELFLALIHQPVRIVATTISVYHGLIGSCPRDLSMLVTEIVDQLEGVIVAPLVGLEEVGESLVSATIPVSIAGRAGEEPTEAPVARQSSCSEVHHIAAHAVGAPVGGDATTRLGLGDGDAHIHRRTEGSSTEGGRPGTAHDDDIGETAAEVGHIGPEDRLTLGVVDRDAIDGDIDTRWVDTTDGEAGVAAHRAGILSDQEGGGAAEERRHVPCRGMELQLGELDRLLGDRGKLSGADAEDLHGIQIVLL